MSVKGFRVSLMGGFMTCWYPRPFWFYDEKHYAACGNCPGCVSGKMSALVRLNRVKDYICERRPFNVKATQVIIPVKQKDVHSSCD